MYQYLVCSKHEMNTIMYPFKSSRLKDASSPAHSNNNWNQTRPKNIIISVCWCIFCLFVALKKGLILRICTCFCCLIKLGILFNLLCILILTEAQTIMNITDKWHAYKWVTNILSLVTDCKCVYVGYINYNQDIPGIILVLLNKKMQNG